MGDINWLQRWRSGRCIACRFEFGPQAPKLVKNECTGCQPVTALCAPEGGECWDKWHSGARRDLHDFDITRQ